MKAIKNLFDKINYSAIKKNNDKYVVLTRDELLTLHNSIRLYCANPKYVDPNKIIGQELFGLTVIMADECSTLDDIIGEDVDV